MMPMNDGMEKKDPTFKCPGCGETLKIEAVGDKPSKKMNTGNMPMDNLKSKIQPTTNPPGSTSPNLSTY